MDFSGPPAWQSAQAFPAGPFLLHTAIALSARRTAGLFVGSRLSPKPTGLARVLGFRFGSFSGGTGPFKAWRNATTWATSSGVKTPVAPHGGITVFGKNARASYAAVKTNSSGSPRSP